MNQEIREDVLLRAGIIDESVKSEMAHIRSIRNKLVHDFLRHSLLEGMDNIMSDVERAYNLHTQLSNRVTEGETVPLQINMDN